MAQTQPGKPMEATTPSSISPSSTPSSKKNFGENKALFLIFIQKPGRSLAAFVKGVFKPQIIYLQKLHQIIQMPT